VRWVRGDDYGVETLVADSPALNYVARYVRQCVHESVETVL